MSDNETLSRYMADCAEFQARYDADGVLLLVVGGRLGTGGCPAFKAPLGPDGQPDRRQASRAAKRMANMMRVIADDLERRFVLPGDRDS